MSFYSRMELGQCSMSIPNTRSGTRAQLMLAGSLDRHQAVVGVRRFEPTGVVMSLPADGPAPTGRPHQEETLAVDKPDLICHAS